MSPPEAMTCVRCGAFAADGPAAAVGVALCRSCFERRSPEAARRAPLGTLAILLPAIAFAGLIVGGALIALSALIRADLDEWVSAASVGAIVALAFGAFAVAAFAILVRRRLHERLAEALAVDPDALVSAGGRAQVVLVLRSSRRWSFIIGPELALLALTPRGLVLFGPSARLAASWTALEVAAAVIPIRWIRLAERSSGPYLFVAPATKGGGVAPPRKLRAEIDALRGAAGGLAGAETRRRP